MKTEYKEQIVNKDWIEKNVEGIEWQRELYPARVNRFVNYLKNSKFREHSLITLWKENAKGKYKVLDGQHKLEAIRICDVDMLVDLRILSYCTKFEAMQEYKSLADVKHHRNLDIVRLQVFGKKNEYLLRMLDEKKFPINITLNESKNGLRLDNALIVLFNGIKRTRVRQSLSKEKLEPFIESINEETYKILEDFFKIYKKCFGEPSTSIWVYKNVIIITLMRIWLANKNQIKEEEIIEAFRRVESNSAIRQDAVLGGVGVGLNQIVSRVYKTINYKRQKKFVIFWDEEILI